jgi:hypothetical protein
MTGLLVTLIVLFLSLSLAFVGTAAALRLVFQLMRPAMVTNRWANASSAQRP